MHLMIKGSYIGGGGVHYLGYLYLVIRGSYIGRGAVGMCRYVWAVGIGNLMMVDLHICIAMLP